MADEVDASTGVTCTPTQNGKEAALRSKEIDKTIKVEAREQARHVKLLLLGTADSGKSTFCKQMTIVHAHKFSADDMANYAAILKDNAVKSMIQLLEGVEALESKLSNALQKDADIVRKARELNPKVASAIKSIWNDKVVKKAWKKRGQAFQISGNADYYFENCERFAQKDFAPSEDDVMRARLRTTGVHETELTVQGLRFTLIDVGGQRSERRKWWHFFEGVTAVIFLSALDDYDMLLEEDSSTNRMKESIKLFSDITKVSYFTSTSFILFLNKCDLFKTKIENPKRPLTELFPDYDGGSNYENGVTFIRDQYRKSFHGKNALYFHTTCALDRNNCERVFNAVRDTLLREHMQAGGF